MLYRPKFCAECGEKIERSKWSVLTSRRFCIVCETNHKGADLIPAGIVVAGLLLFTAGASGLLRSSQAPPQARTLLTKPVVENSVPQAALPNNVYVADLDSPVKQVQTAKPQQSEPQRQPDKELQTSRDQEIVRAESVYVCGAETKKGTPCSRRVKGRGRCFQHKGMPAMMDEAKLRVE